MQLKTRLGWCACRRKVTVCIGSDGLGCREGWCKAATTSTRTHTARDSVAIFKFSTMQTRTSKAASKMRCSLSWGRPARSYLMGAGAVPSGRCGIASCTHVDGFLSHKSAAPPVGEGRGCLVGRLGRGQEGATRFRCSCLKPADLRRRSRATLEGVCAHSLSKADPKLERVHYSYGLSAPEAKLSVI
jgi:hypothetical protein